MYQSDIKIPSEIIQYCYEMQIQTQNTSRLILEGAFDNASKEKSNKIIVWIKNQLKNFAETIRKWISAICKFFTQTLPKAISAFIDKILRFLKIRKSKEKIITIPQDATHQEEETIKKVSYEIAIYNSRKMKDDIKKEKTQDVNFPLLPDKNGEDSSDTNDKDDSQNVKNKSDIEKDINDIKDDKCRKEFDECMKKGYIPIISGEGQHWGSKCKRIAKMVIQNLDCIVEICKVRTDKLDEFSNEIYHILIDPDIAGYFSRADDVVDPMNITTGSDADIQNSKTLNSFIHTKFGQTWAYYVEDLKKAYSKKYLDNVQRELVDIEEIKQDLTQLKSIEKKGVQIYDNAKIQSKAILDLCDVLIKNIKDNDVNKAKTFVGYIQQMQSAIMLYISDASKRYTGYVNYAIKEYTNALDSKWNKE